MRDRVTVWLAVAGVLAVVVGVVLAFTNLFSGGTKDEPSQADTGRLVRSTAGGYSVRVPDGMASRRSGRATTLTSVDRGLVVTVGPTEGTPARVAAASLVRRLRSSYDEVKVLGRRTDRVDGRRSLTTFGTARTPRGVRLRFVVLVVPAGRRSFAITAFTGLGADPGKGLPLVNQVASSFHVLRG